MSDDKKFFNFTGNGSCYLNRVREVEPDNGESYVAVDAVALSGNTKKPVRTHLSCIVRGEKARAVIEEHKEAINDKDAKVFAHFFIGDPRPGSYTFKNDEGKEVRNHVIRCRLVGINQLWVNGDLVYSGKTADESQQDQPNGADRSAEHQQGKKRNSNRERAAA